MESGLLLLEVWGGGDSCSVGFCGIGWKHISLGLLTRSKKLRFDLCQISFNDLILRILKLHRGI